MTHAVSNSSKPNWIEINHAVAKVRNSLLLATPCNSPSSAITLSNFKDPRADARTSLLNTIISSNQENLFFSEKDLELAGLSDNSLSSEKKIANLIEKQIVVDHCLDEVEDFILKNDLINQVLDDKDNNFSEETIQELLNNFTNKKNDALLDDIEKSIQKDSQSDIFVVKQGNPIISIPQVASHCYLASSTQALLHCIDTHITSPDQINELPEDLKDLYQEVKGIGIKSKKLIDDKMVRFSARILEESIDEINDEITELNKEKLVLETQEEGLSKNLKLDELKKVYDTLGGVSKEKFSTAQILTKVLLDYLNKILHSNSTFKVETGKKNCPKDNNFDYCLLYTPEIKSISVKLKDKVFKLTSGHWYSIIKKNESHILYNSLNHTQTILDNDDFLRLIEDKNLTSIFITYEKNRNSK